MHHASSVLLTLATALTAQSSITLPTDAIGRDGLGLGHLAGTTDARRQQFVFGQSLIKPLRNHWITALTFRRDGQGTTLLGGGATLRVQMAAGVAPSVSAVSPSFAANLGTAPAQVFAGTIALPPSPAPTNRDAVGFGAAEAVRIVFDQPFLYVGGTLCIDISGQPTSGNATPAWPIDLERGSARGAVSLHGQACVRTAETITRKITADPASLRAGTTARFAGFAEAGDPAALLLAASRLTSATNLGFLGAPACDLWVMPEITLMASARSSPRGPLAAMNVHVHVPHDAAFVGVTLHAQWLVAQRDGIRTTEALAASTASALADLDAAVVLSGRGSAAATIGAVEVGAHPVVRFEYQ
jgi:hypothetical protein